MSKRILITGGSGLLAVNWALSDREHNDVVLALHNREISLNGTRSLKLDLGSVEGISKTIELIQPDIVVHTAGLTSVEECERDPELAKTVNTDIASNISKVCADCNVPLVHISTDHIFLGDSELAGEEMPPDPQNVYAYTKAQAELRVLENYSKALVVRTNFYGWGPSYRPSFSDQIINSLRMGKELSLFDDVYYTPILAEALIETVYELIEKKATGIYQVVGDERISKYEFGMAIAQHFGLNKALIRRVKMADKPHLVQRPHDMSLSNKKASLRLGHPLGTIDQHLNRLFEQEKSGFINEIIKL